ncbi:hypothetical protein ACFW6U_24480 [Pseudomonas guariconensis]|uniref:hypothetical protein n=1 Tax=Pseudomonas guariconensis TaxID=1288410 RepID=UPI0036731E55
MVGVLVQVLSLLSGLMVNFLTPLIYGVEQYGLFIKLNILVYVFHRFSDITSESLIAMGDHGSVFLQSMVVNLIYFFVFLSISFFFDIGSALLLGGMLLSSSVLLSFYAQKQIRSVLIFLFVVISNFFIMGGLQWFGVIQLQIWQLMVLSTLPVAMVGFAFLAWVNRAELVKRSSYSALWLVVLTLPRMASMTLVFNCLTNFIPYVATQTLAPREIGVLRIMLSVVQSVSSIFPLNVKHIFSTLVRSDNKHRLFAALMNLSVVYFLVVACGLLVLALFYAPVLPYTQLLVLLPLFFCSMLTERYLQSCQHGRLLVLVNVLLSVVMLVAALYCRTLPSLVGLYTASIVFYCSLLVLATGIRLPWRYLVLMLSCVLQSFLISVSVPAVIGILLCTLAFFVWRKGALRDDLGAIKGEIG